MVISPETQQALLNMVFNATNSTMSQSASPSATHDSDSNGFGPYGNEIFYAIGALALTMSCGFIYFIRTVNKEQYTSQLLKHSVDGLSGDNNLTPGSQHGSINDGNPDYNNIHFKS